MHCPSSFFFFFFFNDTATTEIYTLSLHDALPISREPTTGIWDSLRISGLAKRRTCSSGPRCSTHGTTRTSMADRKSTRLNSSHGYISYAVFCLKKKKKNKTKKDK